MLTNEQLIQLVIDNLNSPKLYAIQNLLIQTLVREVHPAETDVHRVKKNNISMHSLNDVIAALPGSNITVITSFNHVVTAQESTIPFIVRFDDILVTLKDIAEDSLLTSKYGLGVKRLGFLMNYLNDTDDVLPLKITGIILS